jgi:CRISPR-associated endonuclease/helicase Cas3
MPGIAALSRLGEPATDVLVLFRQEDGTLTYDAKGELTADTNAYRGGHDPQTRHLFQAQQRELLRNSIGIPASWFRQGVPEPGGWPAIAGNPKALRRRPTALFTPDGSCVHGPVGAIAYDPRSGIGRVPAAGG